MQSQYKDIAYDPAPYGKLAAAAQGGADYDDMLAALLFRDGTRPKFQAIRLNRHEVPAPSGNAWTWREVMEVKNRLLWGQAKKGIYHVRPSATRWA
jgi:hypothetical protein